MPLKYILSISSAGSGRLFGDNFMIFLDHILQYNTNNYLCRIDMSNN